MTIKRLLAAILSMFVIFSLSACKGNEDVSTTQEGTTVINAGINETVADSVLENTLTV
mgnify:CR=1 FL=1